MRRSFLLLLALAGCSRSFPASSSTSTPPSVDHALVSAGTRLPQNAAVVQGEPLQITGSHFTGQSLSVSFGGVPAAITSSTDTTVDFTVPSGDAADALSSISVDVELSTNSFGNFEIQAARIYTTPHDLAFTPPVNAPGQVLLKGHGFSPEADENVVGVGPLGAHAGITVAAAAEDHLLLDMPKTGIPEGPQEFTVSVQPDDADGANLSTTVHALVWEALPAFVNDPPQAFAGQSVSFMEPPDSGITLYAALDHLLDAERTLGTLSPTEVVYPAGGTASYPDGGPLQDAVGDGTSGNYSHPYPPDDADAGGGTSNPDTVPGPTASNSVPAHAGLSVTRDGIDLGTPPLIDLGSYALSWTVPADTGSGNHLIALADPAGTSSAAELVVLAGHPAAPSLACYGLANTGMLGDVPGGVLSPRALRSTDTSGNVVIANSDRTSLYLVQVHAGGAVQQAVLSQSGLGLDPARARLVGVGRDLAFFEAAEPDGGFLTSAQQLDWNDSSGGPFLFGSRIGDVADWSSTSSAPTSILDPIAHSPFNWLATAQGNSVLLGEWTNGGFLPLPPSSTGPDADCAVSSTALDANGVTAAAICGSGALWVGSAPLPVDPGAVKPVTWSSTGIQATDARAFPGGFVVAQSANGSAVEIDLVNVGGDASVARVALDAAPDTLALSPDGQQLIAGRGGQLQIYALDTDGTWQSRGALSMQNDACGRTSTVSAVSFDAAGSHAVALAADDTGLVNCYCELH